MRFLFVYQGGDVPADRAEEVGKKWYEWLSEVGEKIGFRIAVGTGKSVSANGVDAHKGNYTGISIVEANSLEGAVEMAKGCPGLADGGTVEVFEEFAR